MRRLCDLWTKSDDDKADTSRMNDDEKEIVEMYDENEIEMLQAQMDSDGHKPRRGAVKINKTTQVLGRESTKGCGI